MPHRRVAVALGLAVLAAACGGIIDPSKNTVENFGGTLQPGGTTAKNFEVSKNGEVEVTIATVSPTPQNGSIGVGLGQISGANCVPLSGYVASGVPNRKIQWGFLNKGTYCVLVFDPGVLTVAVNFTGTVSHP